MTDPQGQPSTGNKEWDALLRALQLLSKHPQPDSGPFYCSHDKLVVCVDDSKFSSEEIAELEQLHFSVDDEGGFYSFHFANP